MDRPVSFITISCAGKKEVYSLAQVRNLYAELQRELREEVTKPRSIDIKKRLKEEFGDELTFASSGKEVRKSEFLFSSDLNLSYEFIKACQSGTGIPRSAAIKTAQMIHNSLHETQTLSKWPPTPQEILESNHDIDTNLFNLISWIVHSRGQIANNRRVILPKSKAQKILQNIDNAQKNRIK